MHACAWDALCDAAALNRWHGPCVKKWTMCDYVCESTLNKIKQQLATVLKLSLTSWCSVVLYGEILSLRGRSPVRRQLLLFDHRKPSWEERKRSDLENDLTGWSVTTCDSHPSFSDPSRREPGIPALGVSRAQSYEMCCVIVPEYPATQRKTT